jgi:hypothetical protein
VSIWPTWQQTSGHKQPVLAGHLQNCMVNCISTQFRVDAYLTWEGVATNLVMLQS